MATPNLVVTDSGLAAHLAGMGLRHARKPTAPVGPLVETFALGELTRQLALTDQPFCLYRYRDRDQYEVPRADSGVGLPWSAGMVTAAVRP